MVPKDVFDCEMHVEIASQGQGAKRFVQKIVLVEEFMRNIDIGGREVGADEDDAQCLG